MIRWVWEEIDNAFSHVLFWVRGCKHPKMEPEDAWLIEVDGEPVAVFSSVCTVCGLTVISSD